MTAFEKFKAQQERKIVVCDVGASPIEGDPVYKSLYDIEMAKTILFEPNPEMSDRLSNMIKPDDKVFPFALGNGETQELKITFAPGMTSIFEPSPTFIQRMQAYPVWSEVKERLIVKTHKLDELDISACDFIKLDVQGAEHQILSHAKKTLESISVVHTEAYFIPIYQDIPLFSDIDACLRDQGFFFHCFQDTFIRLFAPLVLNGDVRRGINQWVAADCVYVKNFDLLMELDKESVFSCITVLTLIYKSLDLAYRICIEYDEAHGTNFTSWYNETMFSQ